MTDIDETISKNGSHPGELDDEEDGAVGAESTVIDSDGSEASPSTPPAPSFLSELALAMQSVAARERERIVAELSDDAAVQVERARADAAAEAEAFRLVAEEDVAEIDAWAEREVERIRSDAARRAADRRGDLDLSLAQQAVVLQAEIDEVDAAVAAYGATLELYFEDIGLEHDPEEIARRATSLPRRPDIESVRALARAQALTRIAQEAAGAQEPSDATGPDEVTADAATTGEPAATAEAEDAEEPSATRLSVVGGLDEMIDELGDLSTGAGVTTAEAAEAPVDAASASGAVADGWSATTVPAVPADDPWATPTPASTVPDPGGDGSAAPARTGWEADTSGIDLGSRPVAVMDPDAAGASAWPTERPAEPAAFGHTNAAVRLIRSVAPWTAPTRNPQDTPGPHD